MSCLRLPIIGMGLRTNPSRQNDHDVNTYTIRLEKMEVIEKTGFSGWWQSMRQKS